MIRRIFRPPILIALTFVYVTILACLTAFSTSTLHLTSAFALAGVALCAAALAAPGPACRLPDTGRLRGTGFGLSMTSITRGLPNMRMNC
ncbi:membrane protein [Rhodobacter phage RcKickapoo]|nr:membrane protein [Rhodobacter phage RcTiptonus]UUV43847.1 membrane protein [Rhodobacter phage RcKickapoo]